MVGREAGTAPSERSVQKQAFFSWQAFVQDSFVKHHPILMHRDCLLTLAVVQLLRVTSSLPYGFIPAGCIISTPKSRLLKHLLRSHFDRSFITSPHRSDLYRYVLAARTTTRDSVLHRTILSYIGIGWSPVPRLLVSAIMSHGDY